jgi:hypothetical protein
MKSSLRLYVSHRSSSIRRALLGGTLLAATWLAAPAAARAEQFILFDATFTYTKADADNATPNKSHYYVTSNNPINKPNPNRPTNWLTPVDYRTGTVHIRTEVIDKPAGGEITQWFLCYIANRGAPGTGGYGCTGTGTYKEEGVIERDDSMTVWWNNTAIDWTQGIKQIDIIMKDFGTGNGGNYTHLRPDPEKFFPTRVRITAIQVSKGGTYDPSLVPNLPPSTDGGSDLAPTDTGSGATDSAVDGGTGGVTGTGGAGSGGAPGTGGAPPAPGTGGAPVDKPPATSGGGATTAGGCTLAEGGARSGGAALLGAGVLALLVRRRRRRAPAPPRSR